MTTSSNTAAIERLLFKLAHYIGRNTFWFCTVILTSPDSSYRDLVILERVLTYGEYADDVIEAACFTARTEGITNIIDFQVILAEVDLQWD